ncbi:MAG: hypothetical protein HEQ37_08140 [Acidovorax sp.]|nr:hypothetical protein [Acidovorax sp.]
MTATPALTSNDPRDLDGKRLQNAMQTLGRDPALRARLIALLRESEDRIAFDGPVRDEVVGPIIDALHLESDEYEKVLADGTRFQFLYRTKIARDFLLSESEHPSHVWEPQTTKLLLELSRDLQGDVLVGGAYFGDQAVLVARAIAGRWTEGALLRAQPAAGADAATQYRPEPSDQRRRQCGRACGAAAANACAWMVSTLSPTWSPRRTAAVLTPWPWTTMPGNRAGASA